MQTAVSAAERDVQDFYLSVLRHFVDALSAHLAALPPGTDPAHDSDAARGMWFYRTSGHLREFLRRYYLSIKVPPRSTSAPHLLPSRTCRRRQRRSSRRIWTSVSLRSTRRVRSLPTTSPRQLLTFLLSSGIDFHKGHLIKAPRIEYSVSVRQ